MALQELQLQDKMLNDLENKTDKTQAKMDATNDRMKVGDNSVRGHQPTPTVNGRRAGDVCYLTSTSSPPPMTLTPVPAWFLFGLLTTGRATQVERQGDQLLRVHYLHLPTPGNGGGRVQHGDQEEIIERIIF